MSTAHQGAIVPAENSDPADMDDTHDLIRSLIAANADTAGADEPAGDTPSIEPAEQTAPTSDLDLIHELVAATDDEEDEPAPLSDLSDDELCFDDPETSDQNTAETEVWSQVPSYLSRTKPAHPPSVSLNDGDETDPDPAPSLAKMTRAERKAEAKAAKVAARQAKVDAKAAAVAARLAKKQAKSDAIAEAKATKVAARQAKVDEKAEAAAARLAEKQAKADAIAEAKATKVAARQAKADAKAEAAAARLAEKQAKADAIAEAKATRVAARQAKRDAKAEAAASRLAAKQAKSDAKGEAAAARLAQKQAKADAKADAKAARVAARQAKADAKAARSVTPADRDADTISAVIAQTQADVQPAEVPETPAMARRTRRVRPSLGQRAASFRSTVAAAYLRLPERPTKQQMLRAMAIFVLLVEPWLVPIISLVALVSLLFTYLAVGPDRTAEITGACYRWLEKRYPDKAEKVRATAQAISDSFSNWIGRLPERWSRGVYFPDFSKDDGTGEQMIEDRFNRLAREARRP